MKVWSMLSTYIQIIFIFWNYTLNLHTFAEKSHQRIYAFNFEPGWLEIKQAEEEQERTCQTFQEVYL